MGAGCHSAVNCRPSSTATCSLRVMTIGRSAFVARLNARRSRPPMRTLASEPPPCNSIRHLACGNAAQQCRLRKPSGWRQRTERILGHVGPSRCGARWTLRDAPGAGARRCLRPCSAVEARHALPLRSSSPTPTWARRRRSARPRARGACHDFLDSPAGPTPRRCTSSGDLFDFWFEYRTAIPDATSTARRTRAACARPASSVTCLAGNSRFLARTRSSPTSSASAPTTDALSVGARRAANLAPSRRRPDRRGPRLQVAEALTAQPRRASRLYRWLHPDLGLPLAHCVSNSSRHSRSRSPAFDGPRPWRDRGSTVRGGLRRRDGGPLPSRLRASRREPRVLRAGRLDRALHLTSSCATVSSR